MLSRLDLGHNKVRLAAAIGEAPTRNAMLTTLYLNNNKIKDVGAAAIGGRSQRGPLQARHAQQIGEAGDGHGQGLEERGAHHAQSRSNSIGEAGAAAIGKALTGQPDLQELRLTESDRHDGAIAEASDPPRRG